MPRSSVTPNRGEGRDESRTIYRLRVELEKIEPVISRVLHVRGHAGLDALHALLQVAMGWTNSHLHRFTVGGTEYADPAFDLNDGMLKNDEIVKDERSATLAEIAPHKGFRFGYEYDFGDSWQHRITVEDIFTDDTTFAGFAECIDGKRACPPEDCGGAWGYADLLEATGDPRNEKHESMLEWAGGRFDPEAFDINKVNRCLRKIKQDHPSMEQLAKVLVERHAIRSVKERKNNSTKKVSRR